MGVELLIFAILTCIVTFAIDFFLSKKSRSRNRMDEDFTKAKGDMVCQQLKDELLRLHRE